MVQRFKPGDVQQEHRPKACHEGRNSRHESKKIMKNSASFKLSDVGKGIELMKPVKKPKAVDLSEMDGLISLPHAQESTKPVPNYMKPTSSSGAKKDINQASVVKGVKSTICDKNEGRRNSKSPKPDSSVRCLVKTPSLKLARNLTKTSSFKQTASVKKGILDTHVRKATCSSLLKDCKFPTYVTVEAGASESSGASCMEVCTYKYCSLNGHHHGTVQPLKSFIYDRRRSLKKQKSLKLKDDATRKVPFYEEAETKDGVEFVVDIYENFVLEEILVATGIDAESDEESYESIWEAYEKEIQEFEYIEAQLEEDVYIKTENEADVDYISESSFKGSVILSDDVAKICLEDELEGCSKDDNESENKENIQCQNSEEIDEEFIYVEDSVDKEMVASEDENIAVCTDDKENAEDDQVENKFEINREIIELDQSVFVSTAENDDSEIGISGIKITKCKRAEEDSDSERGFNPQEPNYLPLEPEQKAEQVDLKHQDIDERKNSEEWMLDFALQKTVNKLAPVKRKKVELLVEAFESVAPVTKRENPARRASFPFPNIRTIQACN